MEVAPCVQKAGSHPASLLASLNLQREQAQFCDCVIRQRQNPDQLYLAHRCVLAASSPVLASILSSNGALVELQDPCLSDSVLRLVLDYIYRGALPYTHSQQLYSNLLTAACYLQMDELKETLRTKVNPADDTNFSTGPENQPHKDINNTYSKTVTQYLPSSDTCSVNSLEREDQYWDDTDTCASCNGKGTNKCIRNSASPLSNVSTSCSVPESTGSSVNTDDRRITYLTPQDLNQSITSMAEMNRMSRVDKQVQEDQFYSAGTVKPESRQLSPKDKLGRTVKSRRILKLLHTAEVQEKQACRTEKTQSNQTEPNREEEHKIHHSLYPHLSPSHLKVNGSPLQCSSQSPSSPHLCCGAVPVIRHSSAATVAEVSSVPLYHPVSHAPVNSGRASDSRSGSRANNRIVEGITTKHTNLNGAKDQDNRNNENHIGMQTLYCKDTSDQYAIQDLYYKSKGDQSGMLKQELNSSNTDHYEHMDVELSQITEDNDPRGSCDSSQNHTKYAKDDLMPAHKGCNSSTKGFRHKTDNSFDDFTSKHQQLDCHNLLMETASEEQSIQSQDPRAVDPLPVQDSDKVSGSHCGDLCPDGEVKEEQSYLSKCPAEMKRQDSHCDCCGPQFDWYSNMHRDGKSIIDAASSQCEHDKDTAMDDATVQTSLENDNISDTEISEPHQKFPVPIDNMSDHMYNTVGQSYHGHLHYHCIPQEDTHLPHTDPDHKHSHHGHLEHSDQSSCEEEVGTFASPRLGSMRQQFGTTDQVLLLDISNKPAELLVSYRRRCDELEKGVAFNQKDTSGNELEDNDREQQHGTTSSARVEERKIRARTKCVAESFNETETKLWFGETNTEERKSIGRVESRPRSEVIHKAWGLEGEDQTTTLTLCSSPSVPDSVQTAVSSTLSVCIPSNLSASMPRNISAHLSSPVHDPIQCSLCNRSFSQRGSLNRHMRSHLGVRPFPCPRCPMTFSRQYRVIEHMRVHQRFALGSDFQKPPASMMCENDERSHK